MGNVGLVKLFAREVCNTRDQLGVIHSHGPPGHHRGYTSLCSRLSMYSSYYTSIQNPRVDAAIRASVYAMR